MPTDNNSKFDVAKLLQQVFAPTAEERICVLVDFEEPQKQITDFAFLDQPGHSIQKLAYEHFHRALNSGALKQLGLTGGEMFAYKMTGGSNLELPDQAFAVSGEQLSFERDIYPAYSLILCISTYSATAPLTAWAKKFGFRGATLHGLNEIILNSGLTVDYDEVSRVAELMRLGMTGAEAAEIDFVCAGRNATLRLELSGQEAQKSHGLCRGGPDVANLPAGEIYYVPTSASGEFPLKLEDGTIGLMKVAAGNVIDGELLTGNPKTLAEFIRKVQTDPATGELGELGFGTQVLPVSGRDIQDEKILGTFHVATGRSDHLGGDTTPDKFVTASNATHDDILYSKEKTPEIEVPQVRLYRGGEVLSVVENYQPTEYVLQLRAGS